MMEDIAMHILEILMNSIGAGASIVLLKIRNSFKDDVIEIEVDDNGKGMSKEKAEKAASPFHTSRTTRKIGMGLAFLKGLCDTCNGEFKIESEEGVGTKVIAKIQKSHIDTPELGDLGEISMDILQGNEDLNYTLEYNSDVGSFIFSLEEIKELLGGVSINEPEILLWIKDYINQGIEQAEEDKI